METIIKHVSPSLTNKEIFSAISLCDHIKNHLDEPFKICGLVVKQGEVVNQKTGEVNNVKLAYYIYRDGIGDEAEVKSIYTSASSGSNIVNDLIDYFGDEIKEAGIDCQFTMKEIGDNKSVYVVDII